MSFTMKCLDCGIEFKCYAYLNHCLVKGKCLCADCKFKQLARRKISFTNHPWYDTSTDEMEFYKCYGDTPENEEKIKHLKVINEL